MANVKVLNGGIYTTIQDYGRFGYQKFGIIPAGVMDKYSYEIANALVGNKRGSAVLEITYGGPMLKFEEEMIIALAGADVVLKINNKEVSIHSSHKVNPGDTLSFGKMKSGVRAYLAFSGEIDVPIVNGSKSTLVKSKIGGFEGRPLKANDELNIIVNKSITKEKNLNESFTPKISKFNVLRTILGPQDDFFSKEMVNKFFRSGGYTLTKNMDRMGIRLDGPSILAKNGSDIVSDGTVFGAIQIPSNGKPIILMADRQTTGGYTKIGTVITEDICKLSQMSPGDKVVFKKISKEDAIKEYRNFEEKILKMIDSLK